MPKVELNQLQVGDLLLFEWTNSFWHSAIYLGQTADVQHTIAHSEGKSKGTTIDPLVSNRDEAKNLYAFRIPTGSANALTNVVNLARSWSRVDVTSSYGAARGSAVLKEYDRNNPGTTVPFEYDALFRVFKWLDGRERFSANQGTTCCAFAIACFQAGMMLYFLQQNDVADQASNALYRLREGRAGKSKPNHEKAEQIFRDELLEKKGKNAAKIANFAPLDEKKILARKEYVNPGSKSKSYTNVDDLWETIKEKDLYLFNNATTLTDIFTAPLLCDAKLTYSHTLYERLLNTAWTAV
ncbi:MAG: hypothetical protein U0359_12055 [Byssovorax sp.]